jgi:hypothetical protein
MTAPENLRGYLLGEPLSSIIHGQKFWGLRVVAAFLMTVIFMILPSFGYMADGPF